MSEINSFSGWSRFVYRLAAFLLLGFLSGVAWFAALMPVGVTGAVAYDVSRYGFALSVLIALVSLFFRLWRKYGLGVFLVGLLLGIGSWPTFVPIRLRPNEPLMYTLILFGIPLGIAVFSSVVFLLACRGTDHHDSAAGNRGGPASAPRRFGMGTLILVVVATSVFFAAARWLAAPPTLSLLTGSFLTVIGGLQMLMNRVPRAASVGTGAVLLPLILAATWTASGAGAPPRVTMMMATPADIVFVGAHVAVVGAICGYIGGALVAGLFLVSDRATRLLRNWKDVRRPTSTW